MPIAGGVHLVLPAQQMDPVGGQHRAGLSHHRITGHDKAVGLVVVNEVAAGDVDRTARMGGLVGGGKSGLLRARTMRCDQREQRRGGQPAQK
jgi:hypothetical protein